MLPDFVVSANYCLINVKDIKSMLDYFTILDHMTIKFQVMFTGRKGLTESQELLLLLYLH